MDLITKDSETTLVLFSSLDRVLENVEYVVMNYRPVLNGEHYLTGEEVCRRLCISKRQVSQLSSHLSRFLRKGTQSASTRPTKFSNLCFHSSKVFFSIVTISITDIFIIVNTPFFFTGANI